MHITLTGANIAMADSREGGEEGAGTVPEAVSVKAVKAVKAAEARVKAVKAVIEVDQRGMQITLRGTKVEALDILILVLILVPEDNG